MSIGDTLRPPKGPGVSSSLDFTRRQSAERSAAAFCSEQDQHRLSGGSVVAASSGWPPGSPHFAGPPRESTPRVPALVAAEVPIITVEIALAAIFSPSRSISPLGVAWWIPAIAVALDGQLWCSSLRHLSDRHRKGLWAGLAVMRESVPAGVH